jgi:hypothetical protein
MTTDISDTKEGYEIDLDNQESAPNLSHHKTDPNI